MLVLPSPKLVAENVATKGPIPGSVSILALLKGNGVTAPCFFFSKPVCRVIHAGAVHGNMPRGV